MSTELRVGVDVGGTFTDICIYGAPPVGLRIRKVPTSSTLDANSVAGVVADTVGRDIDERDYVFVGTTAVTNALLEGNFARTALITTEGFRDVLEIARGNRASSWDLTKRRTRPVVSRELRLEVRERLAPDGSVAIALTTEDIQSVVDQLQRAEVDAVAICLLHSYANPAHEVALGQAIRDQLSISVHLSSDVLPVRGEYERGNTTALNAALLPAMEGFASGVGLSAEDDSGRAHYYVMSSDGAALTLNEALRYPVKCVLSGPAGGVTASAHLARRLAINDTLTMDVGGTSTDVALLVGATPTQHNSRVVGGHHVAMPSVEIETVGAGGGSIANVDELGLLQVGPTSAGAVPGPACYRRGGSHPTLTDAHAVLGHLGTTTMLGGEFALDIDAAADAIDRHISTSLGCDTIDAARGIVRVATFSMGQAIRKVSIERGHDPRKMTLIAYGGAGPLHAVDVARQLGIPRVIIPTHPGLWSAHGALTSDVHYATHRSVDVELGDGAASELNAAFAAMVDELSARAEDDKAQRSQLEVHRSLRARFKGQLHTIGLEVPDTVAWSQLVTWLQNSFHAEHRRRYGHDDTAPIQITMLSARLVLPGPAIDHAPTPTVTAETTSSSRKVWLADPDPIDCPVLSRQHLRAGQTLHGPAIIEQYDSTIIVDNGDQVEVLESGELSIAVTPGTTT
jgi:N-methylhydantoinase A